MKFSENDIKKFKLLEGIAVVAVLITYFILKHKFGVCCNISHEETTSSSSCSAKNSSTQQSSQQSSSFSSAQNSVPKQIEGLTPNYPNCPDYSDISSTSDMESIVV